VRLEPQPCTWLRQVAATHPQLCHRVAAMVDLLKDHGPDALPARAASQTGDVHPASDGLAGWVLFRFYVTDLPGQRVIRIVEIVASSRPSSACDIRFDRVTEPGQVPSSANLPDPPAPRMRMKAGSTALMSLRLAVRLLPAADRTRYSEEFASELGEIIATSGRRQQACYGYRQLLATLPLRAALSQARARARAVP
jgi:hypothetical protein